MFDLFSSWLGSLPQSLDEPKGSTYTYDGKEYKLIRREESFMGTWYAIPPNDKGEFVLPTQVYLIPHAPTRWRQEDEAENDRRADIVRRATHDVSHASHCTPNMPCARMRYNYKMPYRTSANESWVPFQSELCPAHWARVEVFLTNSGKV